MRITVCAVGRVRRGPEQALWDDYTRRLSWPVTLREVEDKRGGPERQTREAALLRAAVPEGAVVIALDGRGRALSSEAFADRLGQWRDGGRSLAFLIGGADGLTDDLRGRADLLLSLGAMTWPHQLARVMLIEQIYRAASILAGHPYHRA